MRKASYHGGVYRSQYESEKPVYPVISIVIDWTRKRNRLPLSLRELLVRDGMPEEEMRHVEDVKLEIYFMRNLSKEIRGRLTSDMGFVADYLNEGSFESRRNQKILHVEALCRMMEALTGDTRFTDQIEEMMERQKEGRDVIMCEYIDMLEARGEARGLEKGLEKGLAEGEVKGENRLAALIQRLLNEKRLDEISLVSTDSGKRQELYRLYGI